MFNVGGPEMLVILLVALIVLGPAQLPKAARQVGHVMSEIKKVSSGFQRELTNALEMEERKASEKPQSPGGPQDLAALADHTDDVTGDVEPSPEPAHADLEADAPPPGDDEPV